MPAFLEVFSTEEINESGDDTIEKQEQLFATKDTTARDNSNLPPTYPTWRESQLDKEEDGFVDILEEEEDDNSNLLVGVDKNSNNCTTCSLWSGEVCLSYKTCIFCNATILCAGNLICRNNTCTDLKFDCELV